ncbi:MAG: acyl-CoA thioesterase [Desulfobacterales bacterium]|nr:acyl-CoA thioesterase [Desulfobacterales bacterium]
MTSTTEIRVRGYHLDLYAHVNNARYLEFLEEARWNLFEDHLDIMAWQAKGLSFFVVNITINYRLPATLGHVLEIESSLARFGNRSGVFSQKIHLKGTGELVADAETTFVIADSKTGKAVPIKGDLKSVLEPFCENPDC